MLSPPGFGLSHWNGTTVAPITTPGHLLTEINAPIRIGPRGLFVSGASGLQLIPNWEPIDGI